MWSGSAATLDSHWIQTAPIPATFSVKFDKATVTFGDLTAAVSIWEAHGNATGVFARPNGMNLQIVFDPASGNGTWTLSGEPGEASGTVTVKQ